MKIKKINIQKFRKLENVVEENIGLINELYGSNGCGKTSFISFITWMLYGETLDYGKNDDMNIDSYKPYELIGGEITLSNNENEIVLARQFGYNEEGKKTQLFFINGRAIKKQDEYYNKVFECFNIENYSNIKIKNFSLLRALSDPYYLPNNEAQFRELITAILNLDTYAILFENEKYKSIKKDYDNQDCLYENCKDFYNQKLKEIDKDILYVNSYINSFKNDNIKYNEEEYNNIKNELNNISNFNFEENKDLIEKINKLNDLQLKLIESRNNDLINKQQTKEELEYKKLKEEYNLLCDEYNKNIEKNSNTNFNIKMVKEKIRVLTYELNQIKESSFTEIKCPQCGSLVNEEDYKIFNKNKVDKIKKLKEKIDFSNKELETYENSIIDLVDVESKLLQLSNQIGEIKSVINSQTTNYSSDETKLIENEFNALKDKVNELRQCDEKLKNDLITKNNEKRKELNIKLSELENNKLALQHIEKQKENKKILLDNKSTYELRLSLLQEFKNDEIELIKNKTSEIFGNDFEFQMLVKNKSNDNYKKVCYASIDGLEHNKSNTAKYLKLSIMLLEKLKKYIGYCDLPIIFDISDNIGKSAREDIFNSIKNSQIFYTRIADDDNVERKLNVIKGE